MTGQCSGIMYIGKVCLKPGGMLGCDLSEGFPDICLGASTKCHYFSEGDSGGTFPDTFEYDGNGWDLLWHLWWGIGFPGNFYRQTNHVLKGMPLGNALHFSELHRDHGYNYSTFGV